MRSTPAGAGTDGPGEAPGSRSSSATTHRSRRRRGTSLASRLAATVLGVGSASLVVATVVGVSAGQSLGRMIVDDSLRVLSASGSIDVQAQLRFYERIVDQLASGPTAPVAIEEFSAALDELSATPASQTREQRQELLEAYAERYLLPLSESGDAVQLGDIVSDDPAALYLQAEYGLPEAPVTDPMAVDDAADGSAWSGAHARFHPAYRNAVRQAGLLDLYLVDATNERVVYSAAKGADLGTSLSVGPYSGSMVARAADAAMEGDDAVVTDLSYYRGVPNVPVGAAAAPVRDGDRLVGAVVLTYPASVYTDRLAAVYTAATDAADRAGDLYLIGGDGTTRSDPQAYLADPGGFVEESSAAGTLTETQRAEIQHTGTTVLVQPANDATVHAALGGDTDVGTGTSITGAEVVDLVTPIAHDDVLWFAIAEIEASAADSTVASFRQILLVGAAVFVVLLAFVAVAWARQIMRPVRVISDRLGRREQAQPGWEFEPVEIPDSSPVEFHRLADSFAAMGASLRRQRDDLQAARADRLSVLERMLPTSVAQRIARGDIEALDEVPSATVVVVVVLGLGGLVRAGKSGADRRLLDELHAELDRIALEQGLDRIKVVGDSYFAACGHDRPYLDHARRVVAFAEDVAAAVRTVSRTSAVALDTAIGISTGPVTVGMSGGARLVYDVWGPTVTTAHDLARSARRGEIVLTDATRSRLPDRVKLRRWPVAAPAADGGDDQEPGQRAWLVVAAGAADARTEPEVQR